MSLHHVAQHLKDQGRGPDDQLIHMSGKEVAGLQALAMAHGGSLTINPQTGLPEAGFLDSILPTVIGAAGMYFGGIDPATMAGIMGGGTALKTHDLGKGLMAGLGAYGGGNLMEGALAGGATNIGAGALDAATQNAAYSGLEGEAYNQAVQQGVTDSMSNLTNAQKLAAYDPAAQGIGSLKNIGMAAAPMVAGVLAPQQAQTPQGTQQMIRPYDFSYNQQAPQPMVGASYQPGQNTSERLWFQPTYTAKAPYKAASGGLLDLGSAGGGPVEQMSNNAAIGANTMYPMANMTTSAFATPYQTPKASNVIAPSGGATVNAQTGELNPQGTRLAKGGIASLGGYSDGGNLLRGPGDGVSDSIPAMIGDKQPARLADGEFVVPARIVSELGNGSTDAGARQLYKMMDRVQKARGKTVGKNKVAKNTNAANLLPA